MGFFASASATPGRRENSGAVGEHLWRRIGAGERSHYIGKRLRQQDSRCLLANYFIGVGGEKCEDFYALFGRERSSAGTNSNLALLGRETRANLFAQPVANCRLQRSPSRTRE